MRIRFALAASLLALAACQPTNTEAPKPAETAAPPTTAAAAGCAASLQLDWPSDLKADATVSGPACGTAAVLLVVRDKAQKPLLVWSAATADVFGLYDKTDAAGMQAGLKEWLDQGEGPLELSSTLPEWKAGAMMPGEGSEFPFYQDEGLDRDAYEAIRKAALPTISFAQGHESSAVYLLRDGALESVGVQTFPG